ncbi:MAG TPA: hypothetical protein VJ508_05255, partial [Saprospiraceae bacterium]|nr:hypothetical protein [Saprospiraceae bacterium]
MKKIVCFFLLLLAHHAYTQTIIQRLDPGLSNGYLTSGLLPGVGKRILISSTTSVHKSLDLCYGLDWAQKNGKIEVWQASPSPFYLPYSAYSVASITFPSGDMVLQSNNFDCDIQYSEIMYVKADRSIAWRLESYDLMEPAAIINSPGMIDRQTLAFISTESDTIYVDLNGNQKTVIGSPTIYTHMLIHPDRYLGFTAGRWVALDSNFQELNSMVIDSFVWAGDLGQYHLVESDQRLYYLDDDLQILASSDQFLQVYAAAQIGSRLAVLNFPSYYLLDSLLQPLTQFPAAPREQMNDIITQGDSVFVLSTYIGIRHQDLVVRQYVVNDTLPTSSYDLTLEALSIADTIPVGQDNPPWGNLKFYFDTIGLQIRNDSPDTIWNCRVELDWDGIYFCCTYQHSWILTNMALAPNESKEFRIDTFVMDAPFCGFHSPFCFWIESPNNQPDISPSDNYLCQPGQLVSGTANIPEGANVQLIPNPADQWIYLQTDPNHNFNADVF